MKTRSKTVYIPAKAVQYWPALRELSVAFEPAFQVGMRARTGCVITIKNVNPEDFAHEPFGRPVMGAKRMFAVKMTAQGQYHYLGHERWSHELELAYTPVFPVVRAMADFGRLAIAIGRAS